METDETHSLEAPPCAPDTDLLKRLEPDIRTKRGLSLDPSEEPANVAQSDKAVRRELAYYKRRAIELDKQVFQMRTLLQSGKGFSDLLSIEILLNSFMSVCRERYEVTSSSVLLLDDLDAHNVFYRVRALVGLPPTFTDPSSGIEEETLLFRIPKDQGLLWQVIQQGEVFSVRDMEGKPRFVTAFKAWNLKVLRSDVWVPLIRGGEVLGILTLGPRSDGSQIPEEDYEFLQEIARVAATNIDSTLKYEKNARILSNLQTLYDVNQQLAEVNDFKQLTIDTLASAVKALKAQKANLMLYNPDTERLEIKVVWGNIPRGTRDAINEGRMETKSFALGEGVAGEVAKRGKPIRMNDRARIPQLGRNVVYCILSAPLMQGRDCVGVITLTNKVKTSEEGVPTLDSLGRFDEDDEQLLLALADQASVNLHKARLYSASITDRLTGLSNARHFETSLDDEVVAAKLNHSNLCLGVLDIDHFKSFNDEHGHEAGDSVLRNTAQLLGEVLSRHEIEQAFRYGGEEFCVIFSGNCLTEAASILESFREKLENTERQYAGKALQITVSAGVSQLSSQVDTRTALFRAADEALYAAKHAGRNRVFCHRAGASVTMAELELTSERPVAVGT